MKNALNPVYRGILTVKELELSLVRELLGDSAPALAIRQGQSDPMETWVSIGGENHGSSDAAELVARDAILTAERMLAENGAFITGLSFQASEVWKVAHQSLISEEEFDELCSEDSDLYFDTDGEKLARWYGRYRAKTGPWKPDSAV